MGVIILAVLLASATVIAWLLYKHLRMRQALKHLNQPRSYPIIGHGLITKPDPEGFMNQVIGMGYLYPDPRMCLLWIGPFPCLMLYSGDLVEAIFSSTKHLNRILVQKLCCLGADERVDVLSVIALCTLDIICETSMGIAIGAQLAENNEYVWAVHTINKLISKRTNNPLMWNSFIYNLYGSFIINKENDYKMEGRLAFLDLLLEMVNSGQMDETDVQAEGNTFMLEGHDTTSTGLMWAVHLLGNHPDVQRKVQAELDEVMGDDEDVTIEHLSRMKYLECALKEALRLFPSVLIITRELSDDQVIGGFNIPKGVTFLLNLYLVHRDPAQWKDPDVFDPDRFHPENSIGRKSFAFIPFSAGSRNCIGQRFALMEEKVIMAHLLRNFNIKAVELMHEVRPKMEIIVRPVTPIHMKLTRRRPIASP
nr:cytochrome P450 CYP4B1 homolog C01F6.3 [similarity] - Caenorhabditis elegans [Caenorhabditis elegans]